MDIRRKINKYELMDVHEKRIGRLFRAFSKFNVDITGNPHLPSIIIDRAKMLNTYINNFDLHLLEDLPSRKNKEPQTILFYKLTADCDIPIKEVKQYISDYGYTRVYPIRLIGTDLFLSGWNFKDRFKGLEKYPVFSKYRCKYFFEMDIAESIVEDYPDYKMEVL